MKAFRKIKSADQDIMALQSQLAEVLNPLVRLPINDGVLIRDISITSAGVEVEHKLGRQPLGWFVVDNTADNRIWRTDWNNFTLSLDASGSSTIAVWIF